MRRLLTRVLLTTALLGLAAVPTASPATLATPAPRAANLTIFAAASLTDAFRELGAIYEANSGIAVTFNFGASSQLRAQLEQGARADVFASADQAQMDRAKEAGLIASPDVAFATNRLVLITPASNPGDVQGLADLAKPGPRIVTAQPDVPIGVYTQAMLDTMSQDPQFGADFKDRVNANIVSREPNVRQIVAKVQLGEADAGVVYFSDVTPRAAPELAVLDVPDELNTIATYPIALVNGAPPIEAGAFIALVLSPVGQGVLATWNFGPVGPVADALTPEHTVTRSSLSPAQGEDVSVAGLRASGRACE